MRAVEHAGGYDITLSIRWGANVVNSTIMLCEEGGYQFQEKHFCQAKDLIDSYQVSFDFSFCKKSNFAKIKISFRIV